MAHPMAYPVHSAMTLAAASRIVDAGGQLVASKRADGAGLARFAIAMGKALAALGVGLPSREIGAHNAERLAFLNAAAAATGTFVPVAAACW